VADTPLIQGPHTPADLLLRDVYVLDPRSAIDARHDLRVRGGEIAELAEPGTLLHEGEELIEGQGRRLLPAFFDPHVHLRTPGQEHKEDLDTGTRAAAAGGFCAVLAMPNTNPVIDSAPLLRSLRDAAAREARVPVGFHAAITRGLQGRELCEMAELRELGAVGFSDDGRPVVDAGMLRKALRYQRLCGGVLALHEEDPSLSRGGAMHEGAVSAALGIAGIPSVSESTMVARDATLAAYEDGRVHFQHLSCAASVQAVAAAKARERAQAQAGRGDGGEADGGTADGGEAGGGGRYGEAGGGGRYGEAGGGGRVSAEVTPHHLLLTDENVRSLNTSMKMNPPLATAADRQALIDGLRDGTIDCVATDHAPHARDEKEVPFEQAPMGTTGLETAFAALYTELVLPGVLTLALLVERMSAAAALYDLPTPRIAKGEPANLTLIDLDAQWTPGEHGWESRSQNCCFAGRPLQGRVLLTVAAGAVAYRERAFSVVAAK
jgi:dihydroorotase